ncbi:MAG: EF-hand domain-containing protein [Pseudooceanicola sp.]
MKRITILFTGAAALAVLAGSVTAHEMRGPGKGGAMFGARQMNFAEIDANGDGSLSADELRAYGESRFAAADADGDGILTSEELIARMEERADERRATRRAEMVERMLERADDDDDGVLSIAELMPTERAQGRMFDRLDQDEDGVISEEEFARMDGHRRGPGGDRKDGWRRHAPRD